MGLERTTDKKAIRERKNKTEQTISDIKGTLFFTQNWSLFFYDTRCVKSKIKTESILCWTLRIFFLTLKRNLLKTN